MINLLNDHTIYAVCGGNPGGKCHPCPTLLSPTVMYCMFAIFVNRYLVVHSKVVHEVTNTNKTHDTKGDVKESTFEKNDHHEGPPRKKRAKGMNKNRPRQPRPSANTKICPKFLQDENCPFGENCNFSHNLGSFITNRLPDIGETCVNFKLFGRCPFGVTCRFGKVHLTEDFKNITDKGIIAQPYSERVKNSLSKDLQFLLRKKKFMFPKSEEFLKRMNALLTQKKSLEELGGCKSTGVFTDEDIIKTRSSEMKTVR